MAIYLGNARIEDITLGSRSVTQIDLGSTRV